MHYSVELYADQMAFLVDESHHGRGYEVVDSWKIPRIYGVLSGERFKELRHCIARFVLSDYEKEFSAYSGDSRKAAELMLAELGQDDQKLVDKLKAAIMAGEERSAEQQREQAAFKQTEDNIMNQMR
jgi:hypothetical protein